MGRLVLTHKDRLLRFGAELIFSIVEVKPVEVVISGKVISIASWKIRQANAHLLERFSSYLGLDFSCIKSHPDFEQLCNYRAIAV